MKNSENFQMLFNYSKEMYSGGNKFVIFCFALLLLQILDNFKNEGQF